MRVLVGCEFSNTVAGAFRAAGHEAWSCDLLPSEGPTEWHMQRDVLDVLDEGWDLAVFHPPCTYLSVSGLHWNKRVKGRAEKTAEALCFVRQLLDAPIPKIALENPVSAISSQIRKPDQVVQPWQFGHRESKATCLWLKGLPRLRPTEVVAASRLRCCGLALSPEVGARGCPNCNGDQLARPLWDNQTPSGQNKLSPGPNRWKERSRTFKGIAEAMAAQWGTP